uniref:Transmembrane protein n=1 Tax=Palpitomonas bilix TaxID=652834 RepID=A0A7S3D443_9EUKA|mmetsp:Transcript_21273/g.55332  ORF Transcript_21273/g.55332 Transcript_21273/m.55332 type:complete len:815 (+) Transcript_21273:104-2548(+)|eukprot:CAMPEP_0113882038 /NCGR_PEP_ID=MMETSP0780_2-20120614/8718_1 /TAXON_ID=652834 /ORGANISM="Palpitomonas bilix" /LENGTH=814 /DNA_ID=CAMNT_0000868979 /DNA_START=58 /DNA_END=2502 /DNA_ORIENTATION=- /assembly_acc=CAM_ASM_000599
MEVLPGLLSAEWVVVGRMLSYVPLVVGTCFLFCFLHARHAPGAVLGGTLLKLAKADKKEVKKEEADAKKSSSLSPAITVLLRSVFPSLVALKLLTGWPNPDHTGWTIGQVVSCGEGLAASSSTVGGGVCSAISLVGHLLSVDEPLPLPFLPDAASWGWGKHFVLVWRYFALYIAHYSLLLFGCISVALGYEVIVKLACHCWIVRWRMSKIEESRTRTGRAYASESLRHFVKAILRTRVAGALSSCFRVDTPVEVGKSSSGEVNLLGGIVPHGPMNRAGSTLYRVENGGQSRSESDQSKGTYHIQVARTVLFPLTCSLFEAYMAFRITKRYLTWWGINYSDFALIESASSSNMEVSPSIMVGSASFSFICVVALQVCVFIAGAYLLRWFLLSSAFTYANAIPGAFMLNHAAMVDDSDEDAAFALRVQGLKVLWHLTEEGADDIFVASVCRGKRKVPMQMIKSRSVLPTVELLEKVLDGLAKAREGAPAQWLQTNLSPPIEDGCAFAHDLLALVVQERVQQHYLHKRFPRFIKHVDPFLSEEGQLVVKACAAGCYSIVQDVMRMGSVQAFAWPPSSPPTMVMSTTGYGRSITDNASATHARPTPASHRGHSFLTRDQLDGCFRMCTSRGHFKCLTALATAMGMDKVEFQQRIGKPGTQRWEQLVRPGGLQRYDSLTCLIARANGKLCEEVEKVEARRAVVALIDQGLQTRFLLPLAVSRLVQDESLNGGDREEAKAKFWENLHKADLEASVLASTADMTSPSSALAVVLAKRVDVNVVHNRTALLHDVIRDASSISGGMPEDDFRAVFIRWLLTSP